MRRIIIIGLACLSVASMAKSEYYREQIIERISPIGSVRVQESHAVKDAQEETPTEETAVESQPSKQDGPTDKVSKGAEIYQQYCAACHKNGLAGAPVFREAGSWAERIKKKGLPALTQSAIQGLGAMPPKGTCAPCSNEDIRAAVEYMVPQS